MRPRAWTVSFAVLWLAVAAAIPWALWAALVLAPEERVMGPPQRIFYIHVPSAFATYLGVAVLLAGSIAYLWSRRPAADALARAGLEVGWVFCTIVLVTGPIWARPAWGVWWTWEARLTTTLVLWLILLGCVLVRRYAADRDTGARFAAVLGVLGALDIPVIHKAVAWWRGQHPQLFGPGREDALAPPMREAFGIASGAFLGLAVLLIAIRARMAHAEVVLEDAVRGVEEARG